MKSDLTRILIVGGKVYFLNAINTTATDMYKRRIMNPVGFKGITSLRNNHFIGIL